MEETKIMKNAYAIRNDSGGIKLINDLFKLGGNVYWASENFSIDKKLEAGTFIVQDIPVGIIQQLVKRYPVDVYKLPSRIEAKVYKIKLPKIALYNGQGVDGLNARFRADAEYALRFLGFPYALVGEDDFRKGILNEFDVILIPAGDASEIVNGWNTKLGWNREPWHLPGFLKGIGAEGIAAIKEFINNGGSYIGTSCGGGALACEEVGGLANVKMCKFETKAQKFTYATGQTRVYLKVTYPTSPILFGYEEIFPAYYLSDPLTLTYGGPIFDVGENVKVLAVYHNVDSEDWTGLFPNPEPFTMGHPAIVEQQVGKGHVVLFGIDPFYGASWISTYKLIANSLYYATTPR
jgi:hypothetical protein